MKVIASENIKEYITDSSIVGVEWDRSSGIPERSSIAKDADGKYLGWDAISKMSSCWSCESKVKYCQRAMESSNKNNIVVFDTHYELFIWLSEGAHARRK